MKRVGVSLLALMFTLAAVGCSDAVVEERAKAAAKKVQESFGETQAIALAQPVSEADVKLAQEALTRIKEYQGEVNGKLDAVTVNAIQSFQRSHDLEDDGILNPETVALLKEASQPVAGAAREG